MNFIKKEFPKEFLYDAKNFFQLYELQFPVVVVAEPFAVTVNGNDRKLGIMEKYFVKTFLKKHVGNFEKLEFEDFTHYKIYEGS